MTWFVLLVLATLCVGRAWGGDSPTRLSAWTVVDAPKEGSDQWYKANYSDRVWAVTLSQGQPTARDLGGRKAHVPFHIPNRPEFRGQRYAVRVVDGWLVGFNAGEWGGHLWWFSPDGRRRYRVSDDQVSGFVRSPTGLLALEGLAHLSYSDGKVIKLTKMGLGHWQSARFAPLGDAPSTAALDTDGSLLVLTARRLERVLPSGEVRVLLRDGVWWGFYPNSMVRVVSGDFYVGMRYYVVRVRTGQAGTHVDWLLPRGEWAMKGTTEKHPITYRLHKARPGTTRLWTIQPLQAWERLLRNRSLYVDADHEAVGQDFRESYDWMREQMADRLPDYEGHYPWWAYDYRLDLRSFRYQVGPGPHVRLGLAVPTERVLLSAYGLWHAVLGHTFIPDAQGEEEWEWTSEAWDAELRRHDLNPHGNEPLPEPWQSRMRESWRRIFDVEDLRETNTIQVCFERLDVADVFEVTRFTAAVRGRQG